MDLKITPSGQTIVKPTALGPVANTDTKLLIYGLAPSKGPSFGTGRDRDQTYGAYFDTRVDGLWPYLYFPGSSRSLPHRAPRGRIHLSKG